jgi:hypothetical protein
MLHTRRILLPLHFGDKLDFASRKDLLPLSLDVCPLSLNPTRENTNPFLRETVLIFL